MKTLVATAEPPDDKLLQARREWVAMTLARLVARPYSTLLRARSLTNRK